MVLGQVVSWHLATLYVCYLEDEVNQRELQLIHSLGVNITLCIQRLMVHKQVEMFPYKVDFKIFHGPELLDPS